MKTLSLYNLGCSKNFIDGEKIEGFLEASGFTIITEHENADVVIVNTCSFIEDATKEAIDTILRAAQLKGQHEKTLVVSGCFSQRYREEVAKEFPEVDLWIGTDNWHKELAEYFKIDSTTEHFRVLSEPFHTQYLKISEGCSHNCAFCIIPSIRGTFRSFPEEEILKEALWLQSKGVKELIVVSQDTSFYGRDQKSSLTELLKTLLAKTDFPRIRMMYLHPNFVDDALLDLVATEPRMCPYFDIPLQHISDSVLSAMGRRPLRAGTYEVVQKIRAKVPEAVIRTSFILGFPGETEEDFEELCTFVRESRFDKLGVFPYSAEEGTRAAKAEEQVPSEIAVRRCETIMEIQQDISREKQEERVGKNLPVIIDRLSDNPDFAWEARTIYDAPEVDGRVFTLDGDYSEGDIVSVEIIDCDDYDLYARSL